MVEVVYYSPSIPEVRSTARYAHAAAFPQVLDTCTLITESEPPDALADRYDTVYTLDGGTIANARRAAQIASDVAGDRTVFVTTFHYAPVLSGVRSDLPWVVDIYDNPLQYALNNPRSHHRLTARVLTWLIGRADATVHDYHPHTGTVMGSNPRFALEGCPADLIEPSFEPPGETLHCVWAGSPRMDRGMPILIDALEQVDIPVHVSVFGDVDRAVTERAAQQHVTDSLTFHGRTEHSTVCRAIGDAHVGLCVLPDRPDWQHSTPLKVREYMAGGTVPVCSDFSGMRLIAESAAVYTEPTAESVARTLRRLGEIGTATSERFVEKMQTARQRAEMQSIERANEWFVRQCVSGGLGVDLF